MTIARPVALIAVLALGGCISLLPKTKPAQLYRFGDTAATVSAASDQGALAVRLAPIGFPVATGGDRILTVNGDQAAYVAGGRWVTSAASLYESAVIHAFDARGGGARLIARGELAPAAYALKLDVRAFEARYEGGMGSAPTVVVEVYAALDNPSEPARNRQHLFSARVPAADNRLGAIAAAYDQAVGKVNVEVVDWVGGK